VKISIKNVSRNYGDFAALNDVSRHQRRLAYRVIRSIRFRQIHTAAFYRMSPRKSAASVLYSNTMLRLST